MKASAICNYSFLLIILCKHFSCIGRFIKEFQENWYTKVLFLGNKNAAPQMIFFLEQEKKKQQLVAKLLKQKQKELNP